MPTPATTGVPFSDFLPAIFAEAGPDSFFSRFLRAFAEQFETVQGELDAIPDLFRVTPTPSLRAAAEPGDGELAVDSAAGLRAGDVLRLGPRDGPAEVVVVERVPHAPPTDPLSALLPTTIALRSPSRLGHPARTPLRLATPTGRLGPLAVPPVAGATTIVLVGGDTLDAATGDVLQVDVGDAIEYVMVRAVDGGAIQIEPPLARYHLSGQPVSLLRDGPTTTAPPAFGVVDRTGPELVQRRDTRAGERSIEIDTTSGLMPGDVLQIEDPDPAHVEQVVVLSLPDEPETPPGPAVLRRAVELDRPLAFDHRAGTGLLVLGPPHGGAALLRWLAGWVALEGRPDRGERWNRELLRLNARIQPWRGTSRGLEALLNAVLRGEASARVADRPNPLQVGLVSTVGLDTVLCGDPPGYFSVELETDPRASRLYTPQGLAELIQSVRLLLRREKPAHTYYDLALQAHGMQVGVDAAHEIGARVGETTLLWEDRLLVRGER